MDRIRVNSLQLAVAAFFAVIAALMLITPHEFRFISSVPIEQHLFLWGLLFLAACLGLCLTLIAPLPRWLAAILSLAPAGLLIFLAVAYLRSDYWVHSLRYAMLAAGITAAAYINTRQLQRHSNVRSDLLSLTVGAGSVLTGAAMLITNERPQFPVADLLYQFERSTPVLLILTGVLLVGVQIWKLRQSSPPGISGRILTTGAPLLTALLFLAMVLLAFLSGRSWTQIAFYGIFGTMMGLLAWLGPSLDRLFPSSLRTRLAFALSAAMALPLILTVAVTSNHEEVIVKAEVLSRQENQAAALAHGIGDYVNLNRSALVALAGQPGLMSESPKEQRQQLNAFINAYPDIAYFSTFNTEGQLIASVNNQKDNLPLESLQRIDESDSGSILREGDMLRPLFGFGVPTHDTDGNYSGLASFGLSSVRVARFLSEQAYVMDGEVFLVDGQGRVIAHPNELMVTAYADLSNTPAVRALLGSTEQTGSIAYSTREGEQLTGFARVPGLEWGVVVERPAVMALAGVYEGRKIAFSLLIIALFATSAAGTLLAAWLTSPLNYLATAMNALASGTSGDPLPKTSFTEMQKLAVAFGRMRYALELQNQRREQSLHELQQAKGELETRVEERTSALRTVNQELEYELEQRGRLETALVENNQKINDILDSISDGFLALDREWRIVYINRQASSLASNREGAVGKYLWEVYPEFNEIVNEAGSINREERNIPPEVEIYIPDLKTRLSARIYPSQEGVSIYLVDVTESKRAESEREQHLSHTKQLVEASEKILSVNTVEGLLQTLVDSARVLTDTQLTIVGYGYEGGEFKLGAVSSEKPLPGNTSVQIGQIFQMQKGGVHLELLEKSVSLRLDRGGVLGHPDRTAMPDDHPEIDNIAGARLVSQDGKAVGVLLAANKKAESFSEEDEAGLVQLATLASLRLQHMEASQEAKALAEEMEIVFNALSDAITVYDRSGTAVRSNPAAAKLTGDPGKWDRLEKAQQLRIRRPGGSNSGPEEFASSRALRGEYVHGDRFVFTNSEGRDITVLASASPLHDSNGQLTGAVTIWHDITEIEAAQEALRISELRFRTVLEHLPVGVWLADSRGKIIFGNPASQAIWAGAEYVGPEQFHVYKGWWVDTGVMIKPDEWAVTRAVAKGEVSLNETIEIECFDGKHKIIHNSAVPFFDDNREVLGAVILNEDITEFQNTLESLRDSEARLRRLVESTLIAVNYSDVEGNVSEANEAYLRMMGYTRAELLEGKLNWRKVTPPEYLPLDDMAMAEAMERGSCTPYEKEYVHRDGHCVPVLVGFARVEGDSGDYVCFMVDLTERKQSQQALRDYMQQLERSNQDLEDFAFIASHDLQEPLRKVQAFSTLILKNYSSALSQEGVDYINRMQDAAGRMKLMLDDLLQYSRISTRAHPFSAVDLNQVLSEVIADLEISIEQNHGQIMVDPLPVIFADRPQMRQLLQNLLSNALKFHAPEVSPEVHIYSQGPYIPADAPPADVEPVIQLFVEDNGIGFDRQYIDRIFHPFQRLKGRSEFEGSGIGLAICRKIVERHGGRITATSTPGEGSTFIVTLPANHSEGEEG